MTDPLVICCDCGQAFVAAVAGERKCPTCCEPPAPAAAQHGDALRLFEAPATMRGQVSLPLPGDAD